LRLQQAEPPVELGLRVLDRDVLVENLSERRITHQRLLDAADGDADDEIRGAALAAGAVLDAAYVAVDVARQAESALRRRREIRDLQRQLGLVELRPAGGGGQGPAAGRARAGRLRVGRRGKRRRCPGRGLAMHRAFGANAAGARQPDCERDRRRHGGARRHQHNRQPTPRKLAARAAALCGLRRRRDRRHPGAQIGRGGDPR
jgi:hypothetical protein